MLVSIFSKGGAIGRVGAGVVEDDVEGLGLLKNEGGGVCVAGVDEDLTKKFVPLALGASFVSGGGVNKGIVGVGPRVDFVAPFMC